MSATPVADARRRFAARARARRLASARPLLVLAGVGTLGALIAWVLLGTSAFAVEKVALSGTHRLSTAQVLAVVGPVRGEPLLRVNTSDVTKRVAALPGVLRVDVSRDWPGTLRVTIVERQAIATVRHSDGWWLVDIHGVEFGPPQAGPGALRVLTLPAKDPGASARSAAAVLGALPAALLRDVLRIDAPSPSGVQLHLRGGATVVWGSSDRAAEKARILTTLLGRRASVYDVSSPSVVTTR